MQDDGAFEVNGYSTFMLLGLPGILITAVANLGWQAGALGLVVLAIHWTAAVMQWKQAPSSITSRRTAIWSLLSAGIVLGVLGALLCEALRANDDGAFMPVVFVDIGVLITFQLCLHSQLKAGGAKIIWDR